LPADVLDGPLDEPPPLWITVLPGLLP